MKDDKNVSQDDLVQLVSFNLGDEEFGINILMVQEINRMVEITKMPQSPDHVEGVINLRGKVIPVVCLRKNFDLETIERDKNTRIVVCDVDNDMIGMIVDSVSEVLRVPSSTVEPPPKIVSSLKSDYISGIVRREKSLLILLDIQKISKDARCEIEQSEPVLA